MLEFEKIKTELVFKGNRVRVYKDTLKTPGGDIVEFDLVKNRDGAGILLVNDEGRFVLIRQYRNVTDALSIEIPAGCKDYPDEDPKLCALREAEEETGLIPQKLYYINTIDAAIGVFDEKTSIFIGTDLKQGSKHPDRNEYLEVITLSPEEALEYIHTDRITDGKTVLSIFAYMYMKSQSCI